MSLSGCSYFPVCYDKCHILEVLVDITELRSRIPGSYFDYQKLKSALKESTHERRLIGQLIKKGHLIRVKKGLYVWGTKVSNILLSKEVLANLIYGPSYVSLEYALSHYGLIPERVDTVTSVTPKRKKIFETPIGSFTYEVIHSGCFPWGVNLQKLDQKTTYMMASPEKALLDMIALRVSASDLSSSGVESFLSEDMRIDLDEFQKLNQKKIIELASYYKQPSVKNFLNYLKRRGGDRG